MARIALATDLKSRDGTLAKGARITNGYAERDGDRLYVFKRPALALGDATFDGFGMGLFEIDDTLYGAVSNRVVKYTNAVTPSALDSVSGTPPDLVATVNHGGVLYGFTSNGSSVYKKTSLTGTWSLLTSSAGLGGVESDACVCSHGGFIWVAESGQSAVVIWYSADGVSWTEVQVSGSSASARAVISFDGELYAWDTGRVWHSATPTVGASGWSDDAVVDFGHDRLYGIGAKGAALYKVGGFNGSTRTDDVLTSADGVTWTTAAATPGFTARDSMGFVVFENVLVVAGGNGTSTNDLWYSVDNGANWTQATSSVSGMTGDVRAAEIGDTVLFGDANQEWSLDYGFDLVATSVGTMTAGASVDTASFASTPEGTVFIKTANVAYTTTGSSLSLVSDAQYPSETVRGAPYLNGIFYVMDPDGTIWGSAEDDPSSWSADNFITAEFEPDEGVCLAKVVSNIVALGKYTTEMFFDAGNASGSALSPVQSDPLLIGCAHANSVAQTESFLTWVAQQKAQGTTYHRGRFVVVMSGPSYKRISTPDVERILDNDAFDQVFGEIITESGHMFYVLTLISSDLTLAYDFKEGIWYTWTRSSANASISITALTQSVGTATATADGHGIADGDQVTVSGANQAGYNLTVNVTRTSASQFTYPVDSSTVTPATGTPVAATWTQGAFDVSGSCNFAGNQVIQFRSTGEVWLFDSDETDDNGLPIDLQCITERHDNGNNRQKFMFRAEVVGDKVASTGLLRYSDDDYQSWSTYRRMDMSLPRVGVNRLGDFHRRAMQFRHTLSAKVRVEALEVDVEQGG